MADIPIAAASKRKTNHNEMRSNNPSLVLNLILQSYAYFPRRCVQIDGADPCDGKLVGRRIDRAWIFARDRRRPKTVRLENRRYCWISAPTKSSQSGCRCGRAPCIWQRSTCWARSPAWSRNASPVWHRRIRTSSCEGCFTHGSTSCTPPAKSWPASACPSRAR